MKNSPTAKKEFLSTNFATAKEQNVKTTCRHSALVRVRSVFAILPYAPYRAKHLLKCHSDWNPLSVIPSEARSYVIPTETNAVSGMERIPPHFYAYPWDTLHALAIAPLVGMTISLHFIPTETNAVSGMKRIPPH